MAEDTTTTIMSLFSSLSLLDPTTPNGRNQIFILVLTVLLAPFVTWFFVVHQKQKRQTVMGIPWASGWIPIVGHALAYKADPAKFLTSASHQLQEGKRTGMFQINLAGKHMIVISGYKEQRLLANMTESKLSARQAVANIGFEQTLGSFNVHSGTDLHKGIIKGIVHSSQSQKKRDSNNNNNDIVTQLMDELQQALRIETTTTTTTTATSSNKAEEQQQQRPPQCYLQCDLFHLVRRSVLRTMIEWMVSSNFLDCYPTFLEEFMTFQDQLEDITAKTAVLPKWIALPTMLWPLQRQRLQLQTKICNALTRLLLLDDDDDKTKTKKGFWLKEILEATKEPSGSTPNLSIIAELIVGLLFAAHKNPAIGATQSYLMLLEKASTEDLKSCQNEAQRLLQCPNMQTLQSLESLQRLCLETLRLTAHSIGGVRVAQTDIVVNEQITIPKGSTIAFPHISSSWNSEYWTDPHTLDITTSLRPKELYEDEYKFTTFSNGIHKCPGQPIAMIILQCVVAILLQKYQITIIPSSSSSSATMSSTSKQTSNPKTQRNALNIPPISFERATLAQRDGPVMVKIMPTTT